MPGHIKSAEKGKYRITVEAGRDPLTGKRKRVVRMFEGRKPDAQKVMDKLIAELEQGSYIDPCKITLGEWLIKWLQDYKSMEIRETTYESYESTIKNHVFPAIGHITLKDLQPDHLQALYRSINDKGLNRTARYVHMIVSEALDQAVKNKHLLYNPTTATKPPAEVTKLRRALTIEEEVSFLQAIAKDRLRAAWLLFLGTGIRRGELAAIKWDNLNFEKKLADIKEGRVRIKGKVEDGPCKTKSSAAVIPLSELMVEELEYHKQRMMFEGHFKPGEETGHYVFVSKKGTPYYPTTFTSKFAKLRKAQGIEGVCLHCLRHTFATRLLELGEHTKKVQMLMRHSRMSTTADIYSHVSPELERETTNKLNELLSSGTQRAQTEEPAHASDSSKR